MTKKLALFFAVCAGMGLMVKCAAQTVTIIQQGPSVLKQATGRTIKNTQIVGIVACSPVDVKGGEVWQALVAQGYSPFIVDAGGQLVRQAGRDWHVWVVRGIQIGSIVLPSMISSGLVSANGKVLYSLLALHGVADTAVEWVRAATPDPSPVTNILIDPTKAYKVGEGGCITGTVVADYKKSKHYGEGTFQLGVMITVDPPKVSHTPDTSAPARIPPVYSSTTSAYAGSWEMAHDPYFS